MMQNILPPPALQGDERAQLTQVYRYLFRLSEQLNMSLSALEGRTATMTRPSGGALSPEGTDAEQFWTEADAQYSSLKSLIIKTANLVRAEMDQIVTNLGSEYVAVSEWGAYKEEVSREIVDTAKYTLENFEYNEEILNIPEMAAIFDSYRIETTGYIKRGIIGFDDENYPILGIAIGQELKHKEVTVGGEVYEVFDESQNMATYAADKLSFWVSGVEVAYLSNRELVVTRIIVSDSIQLGNWDIAVNAADGMTVQKRIGSALDLSENNTINVTAEKINAVANQIDLSGNTSIVLTAEQVNTVADQINLSGNESIQIIAGQVEHNATDIARNNIHTGTEPPEAPVPDGKLWVDTAQDPNVIRRWLGQNVSTERDYTASASGNPVETPPGTASFDSIQSVLLPVQAGSGDPSPDNIRPISGRTDATLTRCGKNLLNTAVDDTEAYSAYATNEPDGSIAIENTSSAMAYPKTVWTAMPAGTYTVQCSYTGGSVECYLQQYAGDYSLILTNASTKTITFAENTQVRLLFAADVSANAAFTVQLEHGSAVTEFEPYTGDTYAADFVPNMSSINWEQGDIDYATGAETGSSYAVRSDYIAVQPLMTYALSRSITTSYMRVRCYAADKSYIGTGAGNITLISGGTGTTSDNPMQAGDASCVIRINKGVYYLRFSDTSNDLSTLYQIHLLVYGGTMDWLTGVLTVDRAVATFTGTEVWSKSSVTTFDRYVLGMNSYGAVRDTGTLCSHARQSTAINELGMFLLDGNSNFVWNYASYGTTTLDDFKSYLTAQYAAGTPVQIAYKLATPTTIQLSPATVAALKGVNTLHTDADSVSVAYTASGWEIVNDLSEINDVSNRLLAQQAAAQQAIDQLATAITVDSDGAHFYKPGYRAQNEVRIDQDSVDILVGGSVNSSFVAGGLILGNYMLWHPEAAGGLAFNLV